MLGKSVRPGVAVATKNWQLRIFCKPRVGKRELALQEGRAPIRFDDPRMHAVAAEAGMVGGTLLGIWRRSVIHNNELKRW
jgi:hypothetical protein